MYVQAVVCFLFLAIKKCLECIFCHFHVVSLSFFLVLVFFPCLIDGFEKCVSNIQSSYLKFDAFSKFRHIIEKSFPEIIDSAFII